MSHLDISYLHGKPPTMRLAQSIIEEKVHMEIREERI